MRRGTSWLPAPRSTFRSRSPDQPLGDLLHSALTVARLLLTRRTAHIEARFVEIPLQLRDPNALAMLAMICCLTPGTAWGELSFDRSRLLLHVFDVKDEAAFITLIKTRYRNTISQLKHRNRPAGHGRVSRHQQGVRDRTKPTGSLPRSSSTGSRRMQGMPGHRNRRRQPAGGLEELSG